MWEAVVEPRVLLQITAASASEEEDVHWMQLALVYCSFF
jgi:hypothetical protein